MSSIVHESGTAIIYEVIVPINIVLEQLILNQIRPESKYSSRFRLPPTIFAKVHLYIFFIILWTRIYFEEGEKNYFSCKQ